MQSKRNTLRVVSHLLAEFFVVVLGILAAFAVDRWQERRSARQVEARIIAGVTDDLVQDSLDLVASLRAAAGRVLAARDLLEAIGRPPSSVTAIQGMPVAQHYLERAEKVRGQARSLDDALDALGAQYRFDVTDAAFTEALASGAWSAVDDPELRRRITQYYSQLSRPVEHRTRDLRPRRELYVKPLRLGGSPLAVTIWKLSSVPPLSPTGG